LFFLKGKIKNPVAFFKIILFGLEKLSQCIVFKQTTKQIPLKILKKKKERN